MTKTIIFLNGYGTPTAVSKQKFVWNDPMWSDYTRLYRPSATPTSDEMIEKELISLEKLIGSFSFPIVAGHSLGSWWLSNLIIRNQVYIPKAVYLTPLADITKYPKIFNSSNKYYPLENHIDIGLTGPDKHLIMYANRDLITPNIQGLLLSIHLDGSEYILRGGHCYQYNHMSGLVFMKNWIEEK